jgi:hypothetical protein
VRKTPAHLALVLLGAPLLLASGVGRPSGGTEDSRAGQNGGDPASDAGSPMPACIRVSSEARYRNYAYDHIVTIANGCDRAASCEVSTDVNPDVIHVRLAAGGATEVLTFRGSPATVFTARVRCKLDR